MKPELSNSKELKVNIPDNIDLNKMEPDIKGQLPMGEETLSPWDYSDQFLNDTQHAIKDNDTDLMKILSTLQPVVFNYLNQKKEENPNKKNEENRPVRPSKSEQDEYAYLIVAELLTKARELNLDLVCCNKKYYRYNGKFYDQMDPEYLGAFLEMVALTSGLDTIFAGRRVFIDLLLKQFETTANKNPMQFSDKITLINLQNGTYVVENGNHYFREHRKEDFMTYVLPFNYNKNAKAELFLKYLNDVLPDIESQYILSEFAGYIFAKHLKLAKMLVCIGNGRNGKSLFFKILIAVLGRQNVTSFTLAELCGKDGNARALIENKLLNYTDEMSRKYDQSMFKTLSDNNPINGKMLYKDMKGDITNYARLATSTNLFPEKIEATHGSLERYLFVQFGRQLTNQEIDPLLGDKIIENQEELEGVFLWILEGLSRLLEQKRFTVSEKSEKLQAEFKEKVDYVQLFLKEGKYVKSSIPKRSLQDLYREYKLFCENNGFQCSVNSRDLATQFRRLGYTVDRYGKGGQIHVWVEMKSNGEEGEVDLLNLTI